ncbi:MgtC/SapB family protein, partial [Singulisphaera rosea]
MSPQLAWYEIVLRLTLTVIAGGLIGFDRGEHGRPAGLRTTLLVCLAAAVSMIQVNLLLMTAGRPSDSFVSLDLMRLPLGILTGMGFIGGGAILKRGDVVVGVTTAATLWFATILGLCFGGGQLSLGIAALVMGMLIISVLKRLEAMFPQERRALLSLTAALDGPTEAEVCAVIHGQGLRMSNPGVCYAKPERTWTLLCEVTWR